MLKRLFKVKYWNYFTAFITIYSTIMFYLSVDELTCINYSAIKYVNWFIIAVYFIKEIFICLLNLKIKDPDYSFRMENYWSISFLFIVISLIKLYNIKDARCISRILIFSTIIVCIFLGLRIYEIFKYSKNRKLILSCLLFTLFLGLLDEKIQVILTLMTTLLMTFFGKIVIENFFSEQIISYENDKYVKHSAILECLEYKLALICMLIILVQIVVASTSFLEEIKVLNTLSCTNRFLIFGITRFSILGFIYIGYSYKYRRKIKEKLFNLLMREWNILDNE